MNEISTVLGIIVSLITIFGLIYKLYKWFHPIIPQYTISLSTANLSSYDKLAIWFPNQMMHINSNDYTFAATDTIREFKRIGEYYSSAISGTLGITDDDISMKSNYGNPNYPKHFMFLRFDNLSDKDIVFLKIKIIDIEDTEFNEVRLPLAKSNEPITILIGRGNKVQVAFQTNSGENIISYYEVPNVKNKDYIGSSVQLEQTRKSKRIWTNEGKTGFTDKNVLNWFLKEGN